MVKILVAEDERDIRELIAFTLRFAGFEVELAVNGAEAVERAPQVRPDLILMDVRMPRMTGYQACAALMQIPEMQSTPVVFLSAKGQESEIQEGLSVGAAQYILKPFAPDELIKQVKQILQQYGKA
ncbi:MAG TPA: response regulator [Anaerolineae bacterium]|nr:response regulator [Anaerolineae bacterium]HPD40752.1 response regulator [Anaerolineae bacterium]HRT31198.1 response regulator [Anaerolineae bacterium]HRU94011.1 response regulator [Anaerolineae bacterium]HXK42047.1 response regulator [Anaerolineae bacterium]